MKSFSQCLIEAPLDSYDDKDVANRRTRKGKLILNKSEKPKSSFSRADQAKIKNPRTNPPHGANLNNLDIDLVTKR